MLQQWRMNLELKRPLTEHCFICEDHFNDDDIIRWVVSLLTDGTVHRSERGVPKLKNGANPIRIKKSQTMLGHLNMKSMDLMKNASVAARIKDTNGNNFINGICFRESVWSNNRNIDNEDFVQNSSAAANIHDSNKEWNFDRLLSFYSKIALPSLAWAAIVNNSKQMITFLTVSEDDKFRRVQIHEDLSVRILIDKVPIKVKCLPDIVKSDADVASLLKRIHNMRICKNLKEAEFFLNNY